MCIDCFAVQEASFDNNNSGNAQTYEHLHIIFLQLNIQSNIHSKKQFR